MHAARQSEIAAKLGENSSKHVLAVCLCDSVFEPPAILDELAGWLACRPATVTGYRDCYARERSATASRLCDSRLEDGR